VLYVLELKKNLLSVSVLEDMGFAITFQRGKVLICSEGSSPDTTMSIGVQRGKVIQVAGPTYNRIQGDIGSWIDVSDRGRGAGGFEG
jgi:membrane carboxypeptidase/penicillin-binding protein